MIGVILGDAAGSVYEFDPIKTKEFDLFASRKGKICHCTDDTIMTLAIADAILSCENDYSFLAQKTVESMQRIGKDHPHAGYGGMFSRWLYLEPLPYYSFGNGAARRVSPVADAAES